MKKTIFALCITLAAASAFAGDEPTPSTPKIQIFYSEKPTKPYSALGRVRTTTEPGALGFWFSKRASQEEIDNALKAEAAKIGGDAIIDVTENMSEITGTAIKFK